LFLFPDVELRWMNRSDHWQNLAWLGEVLLTPGSALTLKTVYHWCQNSAQEFSFTISLRDSNFRIKLTRMGLSVLFIGVVL
jgi:hypothetical protein